MIKKIKKHFELRRKIDMEILETLCTICLCLEFDDHFGRNIYSQYMRSHVKELKSLSEELRKVGIHNDN